MQKVHNMKSFFESALLVVGSLSAVVAQTNTPVTPLTPADSVMCQNYDSTPVSIVTSPSLVDPQDIAIDGNGDIFIIDQARKELIQIDGTSKASTILMDSRYLQIPVGLAISQVHADLYIGDENTSTVWILPCETRNNNYCTKYYSTPLNLSLSSNTHPMGLQMDLDDHLYIADFNGHRVTKRDVNTGVSSVVLDQTMMGDLAPSNPFGPHDIAIDANTNELLVTDLTNDDIWTVKCNVVSETGNSCDVYSPVPGKLALDGSASDIAAPSGITADLQGTIFCSGMTNGIVAEIKGNSSVDLLQASTTGLNKPVSLDFDSRYNAKTLYIADDPAGSPTSTGSQGLYSLSCSSIVCIPLDERFIQNVLDGSCGNTPVGQTCQLSCNSGHHTDTSSITCLETGWDSIGITCEANIAPAEPVVAESAAVGTSVVLALLAIAILAGVVFLFVRMRKSKTAVNDSDFTPFGSVNA